MYPAIDLGQAINTTLCDIRSILPMQPTDALKGPVVTVRGVGGGKSRGLVELMGAVGQDQATLAILNSQWRTSDMGVFSELFPNNPKVALALAVVSRMASVTYDVPLQRITQLMAVNTKAFECRSGEDIIGEFAAFLALQAGKTAVVLLVDEVLKASAALQNGYPRHQGESVDAAATLRHGMLSFDFKPYGINGAIVLSGLRPSVAGATESEKVIYTFDLPEILNPSAAVDSLFLTDVDPDNTSHRVHATLGGSEAAARQALIHLATVFHSLPRGLEMVQDELRIRVDRTATPRKLVLTSHSVRDVFTGAMERFRQRYWELYAKGLPDVDLLFAAVYGQPATLDARVEKRLQSSLFVNTLHRSEFPTPTGDLPMIELRTSVVSLYATTPPILRTRPGSLEWHLARVYDVLEGWVATIRGVQRLGHTLETLAVEWLRFRLAVAAAARKPVCLKDMLHLYSTDMDTVPAGSTFDEYLKDEVSLPSATAVRVIRLEQKCYDAHGNPVADALLEIDKRVVLSESSPCVVLVAAPKDCWDYGLVYLGRPDNSGSRQVRVVIKDCKAEQVLQKLRPAHSTEPKHWRQSFRQSRQFRLATHLLRDGKGLGPVARCLRDERHLYMYETTKAPGATISVGDTVVISENDTAGYFGFMYAAYKAMKAAMESTIPEVISGLQDVSE